MRPFTGKLSICLIIIWLFVGIAYVRAAATQEARVETSETKREEYKARERLRADGISDEKTRAVEKAFQPPPEPSPNRNHSAGTKLERPKRDSSAKISLESQPKVNTPKGLKNLDRPVDKLSPPNHSTRHQALESQKHIGEKTGSKHGLERTDAEKPETHHHHEDPCESADSPSAVQDCKKGR